MVRSSSSTWWWPSSSPLTPTFLIWQVLGSFVFLNLVVAVILENFSSLGNLDPELVAAGDIDTFKDAWAELDPDADNFIPAMSLPQLVLMLPPPMGLEGRRKDGRKDLEKIKNRSFLVQNGHDFLGRKRTFWGVVKRFRLPFL